VDAKLEAILPLDGERLLNWKVWLAFWGAAVGDEGLAAEQRRRYELFRAGLVDAVRLDQAAGLLRSDIDPDEAARHLATLLDGIAVQVVFAPDLWPPEVQLRMVRGHLDVLRTTDRPGRGERTGHSRRRGAPRSAADRTAV
jgi:hypothetical protein